MKNKTNIHATNQGFIANKKDKENASKTSKQKVSSSRDTKVDKDGISLRKRSRVTTKRKLDIKSKNV